LQRTDESLLEGIVNMPELRFEKPLKIFQTIL